MNVKDKRMFGFRSGTAHGVCLLQQLRTVHGVCLLLAAVMLLSPAVLLAEGEREDREPIALSAPHPDAAELEAAFDQAAADYGVPALLLKAVGFQESRWVHSGPTIDMGYGIMHLVDNNYSQTLHEAAAASGYTIEQLMTDPIANIRGSAALIAEYVIETVGVAETLQDYHQALALFAGLLPEVREIQVREYYRIINEGASAVNGLGMEIVLHPSPEPIDLPPTFAPHGPGEVVIQNVDQFYPGAVWNPADPSNYTPWRNSAIDRWVNHWIGVGTYAGTISWFKNPDSNVSAHFVIRKSDGHLTQMVRIDHRAWHAKNWNDRSIGIEHEATPSNPWPTSPTSPMLNISAEVCRFYTTRYGIPKTRTYIVGHNEVPGNATQCPGPLPWDTYMALVQGGDNAQVVSSNVPDTMLPGSTATASLTMRNTGSTTWTAAQNYRLGAVGDSDPFTTFNRVNLAGGDSIGPNQQKTFTWTMTAPSTVGHYLTEWRMVRDGTGWFGGTFSKNVFVGFPPVTLLADDFESYASNTEFKSVWTDTGNSAYVLDTGFGNPGKSVRMNNPPGNFLGRFYRNLGVHVSGSNTEPLVMTFDLYLDPGGSPGWNGARHYLEFRGYSGGAFGSGALQNLLALGVYNASGTGFTTTKYQARVMDGGDASAQWHTLSSGPDRAGGWQRMKIEILSNQIRFYVNDILGGSYTRPNSDGFDSVVIGSDLTANGHTMWADNVQILHYAEGVVIDQHPTAQAVCAGGTATFNVQSSTPGVTYQWQRNSANLSNGGGYSGVTTNTLTITGVNAGHAGNYRCVVSKDANSLPSSEAPLTVKAATALTQQPADQHVPIGSPAAFSVSATGDGAITYQWRRNGVNLTDTDMYSGVNSPSLGISSVRVPHLGTFDCVVNAGCGEVTSQPALLRPAFPPGDFDQDGDVDQDDFGRFQLCFTGAFNPQTDPACIPAMLDLDDDVDQDDFAIFHDCMAGPGIPPDPDCGISP